MPTPFDGKRIVLGVTGSIAAYKAVALASKLAQAGAVVEAVLTPAAARFVSPLSFSSVTGQPAYTDDDLWGSQAHVLHIGLARRADMIAVVPATAATMSKMAIGLADNLLTLAVLAATCPIVVAPAMDAGMFAHPATQENVRILKDRGLVVVGPEEGHLASGLVARGRMTEPEEILGHIRWVLSRGGPLGGRHIVVTAGGTQEPIDPVRYLTNRSSGKQGLALAQAALDAGARVTLVATPVAVHAPVGAHLVRVRTAADMADAVLGATYDASALIMAAAVADFRPARSAEQKIKKAGARLSIDLEPTVDIVATVAHRRRDTARPDLIIGFAAETEALVAHATEKLQAKGLDLIVANDVSAADAGFEVDTNRVTLIDAGGDIESLPLMSKDQVARHVIDWIAAHLPPEGEGT